MSRRALALAASALLLAGTLAPATTLAADPWTISYSGRVVASFTSDTSGTDVTFALENQTSIADEAGLGPDAKFILEALGLAGTYSQSATWTSGSGPQVRCPPSGVNLACWTNASGVGSVLIPGTVRAALLARAPSATGQTDLAVAPTAGSAMYDIAAVAVGIALDTAGVSGASADAVVALALALRPEAAFVEAALERGDLRAAGADLLALAERAWIIIRQKGLGIEVGIGLTLDLVPGAIEIKLAIAAGKALVPLFNLTSAVLGHALSTVSVAYGGGAGSAFACTSEWTPAPTASPAAGSSPSIGYVQPDMGRTHAAVGSRVTYRYCPPASGTHYNQSGSGPIQPRLYGPSDSTLPEGWIHNLEHGAMVILYRGRDGDPGPTAADQQALRALFDGFPNSPVCGIAFGTSQGPVIARFDQMATPYAAIVWDRVLPLQTLDTSQILAFWQQWGERTNPEPQCATPSAAPSVALKWQWEIKFADRLASGEQVEQVLSDLGDPAALVTVTGDGFVAIRSTLPIERQPVVAAALEAKLGPVSGQGQGPIPCSSPAGGSGSMVVDVTFQLLPVGGAVPDAGALEISKQIMERRLDAACVPGSLVLTLGTDEIVVRLPIVPNTDETSRLLGMTGRLDFVPLPVDNYGNQSNPGPQQAVPNQPLPTPETPLFSGDQIASANPSTDQQGRWAVAFSLKDQGAKLFADYTSKHVGEFFAVVLDGTTISVSPMESPTADSRSIVVRGPGFTKAEMWALSEMVTAGQLPFPVQEISSQSVSP